MARNDLVVVTTEVRNGVQCQVKLEDRIFRRLDRPRPSIDNHQRTFMPVRHGSCARRRAVAISSTRRHARDGLTMLDLVPKLDFVVSAGITTDSAEQKSGLYSTKLFRFLIFSAALLQTSSRRRCLWTCAACCGTCSGGSRASLTSTNRP